MLVAGFVSHLMLDWTERRHAHFLHRLGTFSRLIRFDKRGTGMSDRPGSLPDLETRMGDVVAVMEAARSERAVLFGYSEGGPMSILYAASFPERVHGLVIYSSYARRLWAPDYPWGFRPEERATVRRRSSSRTGPGRPTCAACARTPTRSSPGGGESAAARPPARARRVPSSRWPR